MRGATVPTHQKIAEGNPGKRPEDVDLTREAQPDFVIPDPPEWLCEVGAAEWHKTSRLLLKNKLCTEVDGQALATYCQAWAKMVKGELQIQKEELVVIGGTGGPIKNPLVAVIASQVEICLKFWNAFGMTPAARARIKFPPGTFKPAENPWEKFKKNALRKGGSSEPAE